MSNSYPSSALKKRHMRGGNNIVHVHCSQVQYSQLAYFCQPTAPNNHVVAGQIKAEDKWGERWGEATFKSCFSPRVTRRARQQVSGATLSQKPITDTHTSTHTKTQMPSFGEKAWVLTCGPCAAFKCRRTVKNSQPLTFNPRWRPWSHSAASSRCSQPLMPTSCSTSRFVFPVAVCWKVFSDIRTLACARHAGTACRRCFSFQDEPECLKYFYKEKVPAWGASTPDAARLCQRFVNRYQAQGSGPGCTASQVQLMRISNLVTLPTKEKIKNMFVCKDQRGDKLLF